MSETTTEMEYVLLNNLEQKEKEIEELKSEINRKDGVVQRWSEEKKKEEQKPLRPQSFHVNVRTCGAMGRL